MAFLSYRHSSIKGIISAVPSITSYISEYSELGGGESEKFSKTTGIISRHIVGDSNITASDLCFYAAEKLLKGLKWDKKSIDGLIFVSQTRDYILPSTSCILQDRLGLSEECYTIDIPYGCSGYIYGLQVASSMLEKGEMKRVLLLVGDVVTPHHNKLDKSSYPLFGDAGTATAIEYIQNFEIPSYFHFGTDGSGAEAIIIKDGGYRNRVSKNSFELMDCGSEGFRTKLDCALNGMDVFSFGMSRAPESIKKLLDKFSLNINMADFFVMHQANKFLNEKIRKKLKISEEKTPYSLTDFGNTSCASIPLTICDQLSQQVSNQNLQMLISAFGVGLSWGSAWLQTNNIYCHKPFLYEL